MMKQCFIVIWARGSRFLSLRTEAEMVSQENQASLMPAKLLSLSFLTLSLPWLSLSRCLFLFVSLSITVPLVCSLSLVSSAASFFSFSFIVLPFPPVISVVAAPSRAVSLRPVSSRRGARSGRGSHPHSAAPNKAAFTKVPRPLLSDARGSSLTSLIPHKRCLI